MYEEREPQPQEEVSEPASSDDSQNDTNEVDERSEESFPASDPPAY